MKLYLLFGVVLLSGCQMVAQLPEQDLALIADSCKQNGGSWFEESKECDLENRLWCEEKKGFYGSPKGCGTLKKYDSGPCTSDIKYRCGFDFPY